MEIRLVALETDPVSEVTFDNVRLTANPASFHLKEYEWDKNGNRKVLNGPNQSAEGTQNRIQTDGTYNYEYDRANNTSTRTKISDDTQTVYTWDFHQRLSSVTEKNALGVVVDKIEYVYDAFDRRVGKRFDDDGDGTWDHLYAWLWDGQHEIMQMEDTDGPGTGQPFRTTHRYFYGDATDQLLADEQFMFNTGYAYSGAAFPNSGHNLWAIADHLGGVRDVVDNAGTVRQHVEFDSFGIRLKEIDYNGAGAEIPADDLTAIDELFGYTGRDWDKDADLQYNRARWYDPAIGRWTSPDPIGFEGGDANLYRYVGNHPTSATDPSGLEEGWGGVFGQLQQFGRDLGYFGSTFGDRVSGHAQAIGNTAWGYGEDFATFASSASKFMWTDEITYVEKLNIVDQRMIETPKIIHESMVKGLVDTFEFGSKLQEDPLGTLIEIGKSYYDYFDRLTIDPEFSGQEVVRRSPEVLLMAIGNGIGRAIAKSTGVIDDVFEGLSDRTSRKGVLHGTGGAKGITELSSRVKSIGALRQQLSREGKTYEYVYLPEEESFAINSHLGMAGNGSPHQTIVRSMGDYNGPVVGGIARVRNGKLITDEFSGHFGENWTPAIRESFIKFMFKNGFEVNHHAW